MARDATLERGRKREERSAIETDNVAHRWNYIFISYAPSVCVRVCVPYVLRIWKIDFCPHELNSFLQAKERAREKDREREREAITFYVNFVKYLWKCSIL